MTYKMRRKRRGAVTLEFIIGVLVLVIATFAIMQLGITAIVSYGISHAATVAAREAGKGADIADLEDVVEYVLAPYNLTVGSSLVVILEDPSFVLPQRAGTLDCDPPASPALMVDTVRVTVCVRLDTAPFVNLLSVFGIDISDRCIRASSVVNKEA